MYEFRGPQSLIEAFGVQQRTINGCLDQAPIPLLEILCVQDLTVEYQSPELALIHLHRSLDFGLIRWPIGRRIFNSGSAFVGM